MKKYDFGVCHKFYSDTLFSGEGWIFNGAIHEHDGMCHYICRARDGRLGNRSHIVYQPFNVDFTEPQALPVILPIKLEHDLSNIESDFGPQDGRLFSYKNDIWVIFNMMCKDMYRRMFIYNIRTQEQMTITCDNQHHIEKNWTPFIDDQQDLHFVYSFTPRLIILKLQEDQHGKCVVVHNEQILFTNPLASYRGGSQLIRVRPNVYEGWLHTTRFGDLSNFDPNNLPIPARKTSHVYRAQKFRLTSETNGKYELDITSELSFCERQIEQVYGVTSRFILLNVDDSISVLIKKF